MRGHTYAIFLGALTALALGAGCDGDDGNDAGMVGTDAGAQDAGEGTDSGPGDAGPGDTPCDRYCDVMGTNCTGANAQYADRAECMRYCGEANWPLGREGDMSGNTLECRIYHAGVAPEDPAFHCPHASPTGREVCGTVSFRTDAPAGYTRVDRMGMPAVSTALIGSAMKNAYNDANPSDDAAGTFVPELAASLTGLHTALDDDLVAAGVTPCSMTDMVGGLPECFGQQVAAGVSVASLVLPDTLTINPAAAAGFPNGRTLPDPVIDVTLSVILLRLGASCGAATCGATSLVGTNPRQNDLGGGMFLDAFPHLHPPHAP
ncbi:MAG: DUF4331 family protein [Sandaracinaceae bacterium]|nr:DUF4331 family protein [Sandaracinaceae bacterium]